MKRFVVVGAMTLTFATCDRSAVAPERQLTPPPQFLIRGPVTQITAGDEFTCALGADGHASCWGYNLAFQATPPPTKVFTHLGAGTDQGCGVAADGVWCWGAYRSPGGASMGSGSFQQVAVGNDYGCALRDDGTIRCWPIRSGTYPVPPEGTFLQISAGGDHACGLRTDRTVQCWTYIVGGPHEPPSGTFINVSAGRNFSVDCAVRTDGTLKCWGALAGDPDDFEGMLSTVPTGTFLEVAVSKYAACALRTNGTIACWGNNNGGWATPPTGTFAHITAGETHSCAWTEDGVVKCWGSDVFHAATGLTDRLFDQVAFGGVLCGVTHNSGGTLACIGSSFYGQANPPTGFYTQVTLGFDHACALQKDASIDCWGSNLQGQTTAPSGTFIDVSAGPRYNCAVRTNQTLVCWGDLEQGRDAWPSGSYTNVSAGNSHVCALKTEGTIACWGSAFNGRTTPPSGTFTQLSAGERHNCALTPEQLIVCWGSNDYGEATPPAGTFSKVATGAAHTCALKTDGTIACWGRGPEALGKPDGEFIDISSWHSGDGNCAIKWDHSIECWGYSTIQNVVPGNRAPVIISTGGPYSGLEGSPVTFTATARDPDDDPVTYTWNFDDGHSAIGAQPSHAFSDNRAGGFDVTLTVDDGQGHSAFAVAKADIVNVAPELAPLGDFPPGTTPPVCKTTETLFAAGGGFTDPGNGDSWSITVNWGDGSAAGSIAPSVPPQNPQSHLTGEFLLVHCYLGGTYTINVSITDDDGGTDQLSREFISNRPPVASAGGPYSGSEGTAVSLALGASDPDGDVLTYSWNLGDGTVGSGHTPPAQHVYRDDGTYTIALTATDPHGLFDTKTTTATIVNVAPSATFSFPGSVTEGSAFSVALTDVRDVAADMATLQYRFDCGTAIGFGPWMTAPSASCPTDDNATRIVKAEVKDKDGGTSSYVASVVVTNLPPVLGPVSVPLDPVPVGATVTASASFTDAGAADTHLGFVQWDLGGTFDAANPGVNEAAKSVTANSALAAGVYTISLRVRDDDGGEDTRPAASYVVVYDPSAGFVTGGGWITSPAGAYAPDPTLAGKASFGFVAKYLKGANAPTGNTEFQFQTAQFAFQSMSYQWLVVAGARAQFKGEGTINGGPTVYGFLLTAIDGQINGGGGIDRFRIKIVDKATGTVIYDNQRGAAEDGDAATTLGGGGIVVHK